MKKTYRIRSYMTLLLLLAFSVAALIGSLLLYQKKPGIAAAGMFPLFMSILMVICLLSALFSLRKGEGKKEPEAGDEAEPAGSPILAALQEEFPPRTVFLLVCIVGYAVLFHFLHFYIASAAFLFCSMTGLSEKGHAKRNALVTIGSLAAVYVIIQVIFNIPLN